jgi:glycerate kinase
VARPFEREIVPSKAVVLVAMDKFRGTATARELSEAVARAAFDEQWASDLCPMSDGGEGFRDAFEGDVFSVEVPGPMGEPVRAEITLRQTSSGLRAILEVADVVGRHLLVSPSPRQALAASSAGVGHLILASAELGAQSALIGCGGSATSDGGLGCYQVLRDAGGLPLPVTAATDVTATYFGALRYAEQKGVAATDLHRVDELLTSARALYLAEQGVDVELLERAGAAGGIAGALGAFGAKLASGFDTVVQAVGLEDRMRSASLVVTGEGRFDEGSLEGKVTMGIAELVHERLALLVVCGSIEDDAAEMFRIRFPSATLVSLVERFGQSTAVNDVRNCLATVVAEEVSSIKRKGSG